MKIPKILRAQKICISYEKIKKSFYLIFFWIGILSTVLGVLSFIISLLIRVIVVPSDPIDPKRPLTSTFTITNTSIIKMKDVKIYIGIDSGIFENGAFLFSKKKYTNDPPPRIGTNGWVCKILYPDESFTITPYEASMFRRKNQLSKADIQIFVYYKSLFIPFNFKKRYRFVTHTLANGNTYWFYSPVNN